MAKELKAFNLAQVELKGTHLVEASAGTGKTYAITGLVLRLLLDSANPLTLEEILVVSFTEASTQELIERVGKRLRSALAAFEMPQKALEDEATDDLLRHLLLDLQDRRDWARKRLALAIRSLDESRIFTIHGFCRRQLRDYAFEAGQAFEAELMPDLSVLMTQAVDDLWARHCVDLPDWQFAYLSQQGYGPSSLIKYAEKLRRHAELDLPQPDPPGELDLEPVEAARQMAQNSWDRKAWEKVFNAPQMSGTYIKKPSIPRILDQMEQVLACGPALRTWDNENWAGLYLPEVLETKLKKNQDLPPLPAGVEDLGRFLRLRAQLEEQLTAWERWFRIQFFKQLEERLERLKRQAAVYSFDDLLLELDRALRSERGEELAERSPYKAALIDEFQDTDPVQYRIFKALFARQGRTLFLIGDPKQAIYAFRGADVFAYHQAGEEAQVKHHMNTNWRSDPALIEALNGLFTRGWPPVQPGPGSRTVGGPFHLAFIGYAPVQPKAETNRLRSSPAEWAPLTLHYLPKTVQGDYGKNQAAIDKGWVKRELPLMVAHQVVRALNDGTEIEAEPGQWRPLRPSDIALLVRRNDEGQALNDALAQVGVPTLFLGSQKLYRTPEALELHRLMSALLDSRNPDKFLAALAGACFGQTDVSLAALKGDQKALQTWQTRFLRWAAAWRKEGFAAALGALIEEGGVGPALMAHQDGSRRWSNLLRLLESLQGEASRNHLGPQALLRCLERRINGQEENSEEVAAHQDADAVKIMTLHKSKGLEFPVVFLPYLWEGIYRSDRDPLKALVYHGPDNRLRLSLEADETEQHQEEQETLAESLRLLYVGLTRAKHQCHLHFGPIGDWWHSALAYLLLRPVIEPDQEDPKEWMKRYKDWDSETLYTWLESEVILPLGPQASLAGLKKEPAPAYRPPETEAAPELHQWSYGAQPDFFYRIGSYSSLSRNAPSPLWAETGVDRDLGLVEPIGGSGEVPLADFPRGARAGDFFHHLFENLDFTESDRTKVLAQVQRSLRLHRFDEALWSEPLADWTLAALKTPLGLEIGPLAGIGKPDRLVEMEFTLPLPGRALNAERLSQAFKLAGAERYAQEVARLGFQPLKGYLKGFVDLFFRHGEVYYLLDYKSNHLGGTFGDYGPEQLERAMAEHHYPLQAWLYCLAAHRHLKRTIPHYDYHQHFGGACYLFLRGLTGPGHQGVWWEKPPLEALEALDRLIQGEA